MAQFRVETVLDKSNNLYRLELYYPSDSQTPVVVGKPIYSSHEHAMADAVSMFEKALPDQPITAWRSQ